MITQYKEKKVWWAWNKRWFGWKFHLLHGFCAWELQIGPHVFQWFYRNTVQRHQNEGRFRHWYDEYGHRKMGWR